MKAAISTVLIALIVGCFAFAAGYAQAPTPKVVTRVQTNTRTVVRTVAPQVCGALPTDVKLILATPEGPAGRAAVWQEFKDIAACAGVPLADVVGADRAAGA